MIDSLTLELERIESALTTHTPVLHPTTKQTRRAAVATILRQSADHVEALFILRATKEGDPWSGQMAFPGGHVETVDESLRHTAERETWEEIGLDLSAEGRYLGPLNEVKANPRGRSLDMVVSPHVFLLENPQPEFSPNYEVADVLWGSLNDMYHQRTVGKHEFEIANQKLIYPGYSVGGQVVWGLTLRMVEDLFGMLNPAWRSKYNFD